MQELTLKEFMKEAPREIVVQFAERICNPGTKNPVDYLYQITGGHRQFSYQRAMKAEQVALELGYCLPRHKLRPDIWNTSQGGA